MNVKIVGTTKPNNVTSIEEFNTFSGHCAGVCYMVNDYDTLFNEDEQKTNKRVEQTMSGGHFSVFDHNYINLYLEDVPKLLAMFLNNENMYTTSEKSARYTKMDKISQMEQEAYDEWFLTFREKFRTEHLEIPEKKREKLAMENARYLLSIFAPTCLVYTVSYRQLNYIYYILEEIMDVEQYGVCFNREDIKQEWQKTIKDFRNEILKTGYINPKLKDLKRKNMSLFIPKEQMLQTNEIFSNVYSTVYSGSYAQLAQAQRHRTIHYSICETNADKFSVNSFYCPPILGNGHKREWLKTCNKLLKAGIIPQCKEVMIREQGIYENFIMKCKERICSAAQLEISQQTQKTLLKYITSLSDNKIPYLWEDIQKYMTYKARCSYPDFKCPTPCGWEDGINLTRDL